MIINKTEKFKLRKSKKYKNLVSVGLGVVTAAALGVATDTQAHASNTETSTNSATSNNTVQVRPTQEQAIALQNENNSQGAVKVTVDSSQRDKKVEEAKKQGVEVIKNETKDLGVAKTKEEVDAKKKEVEANYKKQEQDIQEKTIEYVKEKEEHKNTETTIRNENLDKKRKYEQNLANYNKEKKEKEELNKNITKENAEITERNKNKKTDYENKLKELQGKQEQNKQDIKNEQELVVKAGGRRDNSKATVEIAKGEIVDVKATGTITVTDINNYQTTTNSSLKIKLPNSDIRDGSYVELKYERLREEQLKDYDVKVNGEKIGTLKLVSIDNTKNADYDPNKKDETYDAYTSMHNYNFRLIFNENANKYKNREVTISSNNTANWNGFYGKEKQGVNHNIYVNGTKVVSSVDHNIPATDLSHYKDWDRVVVDDTELGVFINEDGSIRPNGMFGKIANSHDEATVRTNKLTDGDIITYRIDNNSPVKFDPTQKYDVQNMFWNQTGNFGAKTWNKYGSIIGNGSHLPNVEVLNFTDTELKVKITNVDNKYFSLRADSYKRIPMKITSYNKADYNSDRKYNIYASVTDANGNIKAERTTSRHIGISGANIDTVGDLKPQNTIDVYKIKINYIDEAGTVIKDVYRENNLYFGDKYTVNVPAIKGYTFIKEKDNKILNGVFREDKEYTLVYKKLEDVVDIKPPTYETPKPLVELPIKPIEPTYKEVPTPPKTPEIEVINYVFSEQTQTEKVAKNNEGTNLDKQLVNKMSEVKFELKTANLSAGREKITIFEITDNLPQGYIIDEKKVSDDNLLYEVRYDKKGHTLVFKATQGLLNNLNKDLTKEISVVNPIVSGVVTNDGAIYRNNFKLNLNNKYTKYSNTVTVTTPTDIIPNKHNYNEDGELLDGKQVVAGTKNYYKLLWDLDQYKGIKASKEDIKKGFFFIDDYPEEALTIDNSKVSMVDSKGQAVTGVEVNSYNSLKEAPENVKTMLSKANITPKGAFQLFTATNPTDFYNKYVVTGNSIKITNPMVVKDSLTQTGGAYENKAYQIDLGNGYATETVRNIVPKVDTKKHNYNEDGELLDGKQVVAGTTNHYKLTWDLDQYRGMSATNSEIAKGFFFVEDYPEEALTIDNSKVTMLDGKGQAVTGVEVSSYNSLENAPEDIKQALVNAKIRPKGAFQLFRATNAKDFFNKYVLTGNSITITTPMKVKEELTTTGGTYNNKAYQVDFGKAFETNIVTNIVPKVTPEKHNTNEDGVVVDGKQIVAGTTNYYKLTWDLTPYKGVVPTRNELNKGFFFVEDYPEKEVTIDNSKVTMVDSKGQAVTGVEVSSYNSLEEAPENVKTMLSKANISPKGAFQLFNASSPVDFFNKYASVGNSITITTPMKVKEELTTTGGTIRNKGYQIDFGKGRETETIINEIPKVTPEKHNTNKDGIVVDGKQVVAGTTNYYKLTWDLDQYKDIVVTKGNIKKGFFFVDDYPEEALTLDNSKVSMVDSKGQAVTGVEVSSYNSLEEAPETVRQMLSKAKITPKGAFQLFKATNEQEFFNEYVVKGNSITITSPMTVKPEMAKTGGSYENKAYQIDFGIGYETEVVVNNVPKIEAKKDVVVDVKGKESLEDKEITLNTVFNYHLVGSKLPGNRGVELIQYGFSDDYDEKGDKYQGNYKVFSMTDIKLKDGTIINKDSELTKYTIQKMTDGKVNIEFDKKFLDKVDLDSEFQAEVYLQMERINPGEFENTFVHTVNGIEVKSNTVKTKTEKPKDPEAPSGKVLPKTGITSDSTSAGLTLGVLAMAAAVAKRKRKEQKN